MTFQNPAPFQGPEPFEGSEPFDSSTWNNDDDGRDVVADWENES